MGGAGGGYDVVRRHAEATIGAAKQGFARLTPLAKKEHP